jgi:DNA-binding GntR family transcriptional regulator
MWATSVGCTVGAMGSLMCSAHETRADEIAELLRQRVVDGHYQSGAHLTGSALAAELNANQTVVREALRVLRREGLVVGARRGAIVRAGARSVGLAASEFREALDGLAARLAAERADSRFGGHLASCVAQLRTAAASADPHAALWADIAFHLLIIDASANQLLIGQRTILASTLRGIQLAYVPLGEAIATEHEEVLAAVLARDAIGADAKARAHARADMSRFLERVAVTGRAG